MAHKTIYFKIILLFAVVFPMINNYIYNYMMPVKFEWDEKKNEINIRKHGVSFDDAKSCFEDDFAEIFEDQDHSINGDRFILLGMSSSLKTLVVIFTERNRSTKLEICNRIISARKATKKEFQYYWSKRKLK